MSKATKFLRYYLPIIVYMGIIVWLSNKPSSDIVLPDFPSSDKVLHFIEYGGLTWLLCRAIIQEGRWKLASVIEFIIFIVVIFAVTDEFHQYFIPGREARIGDIIADTAGAVFVCGLFSVFGNKSTNQ